MSINIKLRPGGRLLAMLFAVGIAPSVWAQTAVGTSVTNSASVDYTVGGVNQADITSNTDSFLVDRLIDLNVVERSGTFTSITPDQTTFTTTLAFTITNTGNGTQDIAVLAANAADATADPFGGNADSWDAQGAIAYYLDDGDDVFEPGAGDTALPTSAGTSYLDEVASGGVRVVWVEFADMPANDPGNTLDGDPDKDMDNGNNAVVSMVGTVRAGGGAAALGAALSNDNAIADTAGTVQTVFGDADGPYDGAADAAESDDDAFRVSTAVITISKTSSIISDPINGGTNPKRIPGATVRYTITVANGAGAAAATGVIISDTITSADVTYVSNSLYQSADATCNTSDTLLTEAADADFGIRVGNVITFGDSTGADLGLAASATQSFCYDVTIN